MRSRSRVLIFTGDGKGKTTAALGMALRASGHGLRTFFLQFIKANPSVGELYGLRYLPGVEVVQMGRGVTPRAEDPAFAEHRKVAEDALKIAFQALQSKRYDLIILDEICTAVRKGLLEEDEVVDLLSQGDERVCFVLTGRGAPEKLFKEADTVTVMDCLKHGLQKGWGAQKGVEY